MKYVWLLLLVVGLAYTWGLGTPERDSHQAMMTDNQLQLANLITESIRQKRPEVSSVNFSQLYTEIVKPDQEMIAHYRYEITSKQSDDTTTEVVEGSSKLISEDGNDWRVVSTEVQQPLVGFQKGETVTRQQAEDSKKSETH